MLDRLAQAEARAPTIMVLHSQSERASATSMPNLRGNATAA